MDTPDRPQPVETSAHDAAFWAVTAASKFRLQRCKVCGEHWFPPGRRCQHCLSRNWEWVAATGTGSVYAATTVYRAPADRFVPEVPYVVALIDLDEGPRVLSNVVGESDDPVEVGARVRAEFVATAGGAVLPMFRREQVDQSVGK
jgi:uncharacterized OB-fold protein